MDQTTLNFTAWKEIHEAKQAMFRALRLINDETKDFSAVQLLEGKGNEQIFWKLKLNDAIKALE